MAAGYLLRQEQRAEDRASELRACGHESREYAEYPCDDPRFRPLLFRCRVPGCGVELDLAREARRV